MSRTGPDQEDGHRLRKAAVPGPAPSLSRTAPKVDISRGTSTLPPISIFLRHLPHRLLQAQTHS